MLSCVPIYKPKQSHSLQNDLWSNHCHASDKTLRDVLFRMMNARWAAVTRSRPCQNCQMQPQYDDPHVSLFISPSNLIHCKMICDRTIVMHRTRRSGMYCSAWWMPVEQLSPLSCQIQPLLWIIVRCPYYYARSCSLLGHSQGDGWNAILSRPSCFHSLAPLTCCQVQPCLLWHPSLLPLATHQLEQPLCDRAIQAHATMRMVIGGDWRSRASRSLTMY